MNDTYKKLKDRKSAKKIAGEAGAMGGLTSLLYGTAMQLEPVQNAMANLNIENQTATALGIGALTGIAYLAVEGASELFARANLVGKLGAKK